VQSCAINAGRVALFTPQGETTYAELDAVTNRFAAALLRLGVTSCDRVLFQSANSRDLVIALLGCLKVGLIPICTLAAHREREIGYLGCHGEARVHIVQGDDSKFDLVGFAAKMRPTIPTMRHVISLNGDDIRAGVHRMSDLIAGEDSARAAELVQRHLPRDPFQVAIFQLSGGTTGLPKMIPRMQNDYLLNACLTADWLGFRSTDVMFMPMPIIHNACMICFLLPSLLSGAAFTIAEDMNPDAWARAFKRAHPTWIGVIRALLPRPDAMIAEDSTAMDSVRAIWCPDAARVVRNRYKRATFAMFGMSEGMSMYTAANDPTEVIDSMVGRPLSRFDEIRLVRPGTDIEVEPGEIGELHCRGPYTLRGYYNAPERNAEAFTPTGFYKSGDLMIYRIVDGERVYAFAGRTKDVIDRGTEKVNCEEVEQVVAMHPAVPGCAVVGMPDEVLGERVCAYIVLRRGFAVPTVGEMGSHMQASGIAKFKWPERIETIGALPLTKVGKLDKAPLREDIRSKCLSSQPLRTIA
jgi:non-ribosomal peptide synthetase component E (peptide arylation enzyme)